MNRKNYMTTKKTVLAALLAALTAVGSGIRITIPLSIAGTTAFHLGNIICALSGILLGPWLGGLAAGLGSAIYDMFNPMYIAEAWLTFLMKGALGLAAGLVAHSTRKEWGYVRATMAALAGSLVYAILYLAKSYFKGIWIQGLTDHAAVINILDKIPATIFNAAVAVIFAPILATAIRTALKRNHMTLD